MRTCIAIVAAVCVALVVPTAAAAEQGRPDYCTQYPVLSTAKGAVPRANRAWDAKHLKTRESAVKRVRIQSHCAPSQAGRRHVNDAIDHARGKYHRAVLFARYTPYDCGANGNWAIPCYIVERESRFEWGAANPSGAVGPYQLLGWGAPYPATTWRQKLENHRIAYNLWAGGAGCSNWSAC